MRRGIMILDMSFTLSMIRERQLEQALAVRSLDGYFDQVVSVHPLAGLFADGRMRFGAPVTTEIEPGHVFVEGKIGISRWLSLLPPLNLLLAQLQLGWQLWRKARSTNVRVIRIGDPYYLGLLGLVLAWTLRVPLAIRACFDYDLLYATSGKAVFPRLFRYRWIEKLIERFVFPRCQLVAGANQNNLDYAIAHGAAPNCGVIFRYGNLIHPAHFSEPISRTEDNTLLTQLGVKGDFLMTVCRLEPMKQPEQTLLVLRLLRNEGYPDLQLVLVGDGSMRKQLEDMVSAFELKGNVVFAGNRPQEWIAGLLPSASVILSPHMGRGLTEACLAAAPIVAYDYDWQREIIHDGVTGELVANGDWREMAKRAQSLLADRPRAKELGLAARRLAMAMMDPEKLTQREIQAYEHLFNPLHKERHDATAGA